MLQVRYSSQFRKDMRRLEKQGKDMGKIREAILILAQDKGIPSVYGDHSLKGEWIRYREIHIEPDLLLIYRVTEEELLLVSCGSHAELFEK